MDMERSRLISRNDFETQQIGRWQENVNEDLKSTQKRDYFEHSKTFAFKTWKRLNSNIVRRRAIARKVFSSFVELRKIT